MTDQRCAAGKRPGGRGREEEAGAPLGLGPVEAWAAVKPCHPDMSTLKQPDTATALPPFQ